jgi:delta14-sterol reductase
MSYSLGAAAITFGLPLLLYIFAFACNDLAGCPIPPLLHPRSLSLEKVKADTGLLNARMANFFSWEVTLVTVAYYIWGLLLWRILPAKQVYGTKLVHHGRPLSYRFNGNY